MIRPSLQLPALCVLAVACTPAQPPPLGWIGELASAPEQADSALAPQRQGWVAVHAGRPWEVQDPAGPAAALAALDLALLHADLAELHHVALERLVTTWRARGTLPANTAAADLLALSRSCRGDDDARADGPIAAALADRAAAWEAARAGDVRALDRAGPLWVEPGAAGLPGHRWEDPCADLALAHGHLRRATSLGAFASDGPDLFAPWLDRRELDAATGLQAPATPAALAEALGRLAAPDALGLDASDPGTVTPEAARASARRLTEALDGRTAQLAGLPGAETVDALRLVARQRQRWLVDRARLLLRAGNAPAALALLEPAVDATAPDVGPTRSAHLVVLLAHARMASGRTREALDALRPLVEAFDDAGSASEVVADLAVLEGLDRLGDSKEL